MSTVTAAEVLARHAAQAESDRRAREFRGVFAVMRDFEETVLGPGIQTLPIQKYSPSEASDRRTVREALAFVYDPYLLPEKRCEGSESTDWEPQSRTLMKLLAEATGLDVHWKRGGKMFFTPPGALCPPPAVGGRLGATADLAAAVSAQVARAVDGAAWHNGGLSTD